MDQKVFETLQALFYPTNAAVVGASTNPAKLGFQALLALKTGGMAGKVFPISPSLKGRTVLDMPGYGAIEDIPEPAQLFVLAVPHDRIEGALISAAKKGAKGAVIFAGGFREVGEDGAALQSRIKQTADRLGVKIVGPNCVGALNLPYGLNATFGSPLSQMKRGRVSLVSQSGGTGSAILTTMMDNNVGVSKFVSIGNRVNLDFPELVQYLAEDKDTDVICLFIEGMDDGRAFLAAARQASKKKPIIAYQAGFTEATRRLALSHTGSMSASREIYAAAYRQAGVLFVSDYEELVDTAKAVSMLPQINGTGVAIFTHTAGPALIVAQTAEEAGGTLPDFTADHKEKIVGFAPQFTVPTNPLDMFAHAWFDTSMYLKAAELALSQPDIHLACACYSSGIDVGIRFPAAEFAAIAKKYNKPALACLMATHGGNGAVELSEADDAGTPTFNSPHKAGKTIANLIRLWRMRQGMG
ncbi:MAG: CoA-binding protein [Deltaproteobacteria bacterium]|nr:CoA-binding protein [Candidatus Zymogenaceae bacterium]